jgi:hypothetical protein
MNRKYGYLIGAHLTDCSKNRSIAAEDDGKVCRRGRYILLAGKVFGNDLGSPHDFWTHTFDRFPNAALRAVA